ncbi:TonB-dependent receptor plug domain-containing protein [Iodobacter ciconiae]|uniref:TonB-dependent receptor n=1 Tax=Iodobacter ciconiae TaxID=2496266 RepID=A0A3S8ZTC5_9NEIS|nr:TonB-dependent receptor [Iodobacter ciconiae]AZN36675.1 TonB-dependent receptor [Iodobacter ciconiae]
MKYLFLFFFLSSTAWAESDSAILSLEDLLDSPLINPPNNVDVSTASKFSQTIKNAPSAVRVMSRDDIQLFGYRTLGEILRSMPGLFTSYDGQNTFLGARGIAIPGDFNTRVLILIDGIRLNNNVFDSALVGNEFPLDVDLIDRVEYVPGPGSAIYGNNAFLGVVNVLTRGAASLRGAEASLEYGSFNTSKLRASMASRLDNGMEYLVSATQFRRGGPDHPVYMDYAIAAPEFKGNPATDSDLSRYLFAKLSMGGLQMTGAFASREKANPVLIGSVNSDESVAVMIKNGKTLNDSLHSFIGLTYDFEAFSDWNMQARLNYHEEEYKGHFPEYFFSEDLNTEKMIVFKENYKGRWWDGELHALYNQLPEHKILLGVEGRVNAEQFWHSYAEGFNTEKPMQQSSSYYAFFAQDEYKFADHFTLIAGARYDYTEYGNHFNPRLGLLWDPLDKTYIKLLYGSAFRNPNFFEQSQNKASNFRDAGAEKITTLELVAEHYLTPAAKLNGSVYHYKMNNLIGQSYIGNNLIYTNLQKIRSTGFETEFEQWFDSGIQAKLAYSLQKTTIGNGTELFNSPRHMLNFKFLLPFADSRWKLATELRYLSSVDIFYGMLPKQWLADMVLNGDINKNCSLSLSIHNLADTSSFEATRYLNFDRYSIKQDGRDIRLKINFRY